MLAACLKYASRTVFVFSQEGIKIVADGLVTRGNLPSSRGQLFERIVNPGCGLRFKGENRLRIGLRPIRLLVG